MSDDRQFPLILWQGGLSRKYPDCPKSIPWSAIAPHEQQARINHGQTLEELASRGGLSPGEAMLVIQGRPWLSTMSEDWRKLEAEAVEFVKGLAGQPV